MTLSDIMFYLFAGSILTFSVLTVTSRRILRSAVYLPVSYTHLTLPTNREV